MGDVIVTQFSTLDGVVSDPDGRGGTGYGGWAFRYGSGPVADDKFRLGDRMDRGVQLYGRRTWEAFAALWPGRDGAFAKRMNDVPKHVATRTGIDPQRWQHSRAIGGDAVAWVEKTRESTDIVVIGSLSLIRQLAAADLVDEYRLVTFPLVTGEGDRLFSTPGSFEITMVEQVGPTVLTQLRRVRD
ncbi:dihydrofolate reductase family protein [Actinoplanes sp. L3-i22]|uniref:dihydrofolate reductase family protein n=1 Tax=Actinoplanes sp. L3-i22 TaxID=2836373 RepID=UPI001C861A4C|nr:dihydrofolate reductase family protein [Actinoplanes sp. L3-i22]